MPDGEDQAPRSTGDDDPIESEVEYEDFFLDWSSDSDDDLDDDDSLLDYERSFSPMRHNLASLDAEVRWAANLCLSILCMVKRRGKGIVFPASKLPEVHLARYTYMHLARNMEGIIVNQELWAPVATPGFLTRKYGPITDILWESVGQISQLPVHGQPQTRYLTLSLRECVLRAEAFRAAGKAIGIKRAWETFAQIRSESGVEYAVESPLSSSEFNTRLDRLIKQAADRCMTPRMAKRLLQALREGEAARRHHEASISPDYLRVTPRGTAVSDAEEYYQALATIEERWMNNKKLASLRRRAQMVAIEPELFRGNQEVSMEDNLTVKQEVMASIDTAKLKAPVWDRNGGLVGYIKSPWKDFEVCENRREQDRFWHQPSPLRKEVFRSVEQTPQPPAQSSPDAGEHLKISPTAHSDSGISLGEY